MKMQEKKLRKFKIYDKISNVLYILSIIFGVLMILFSTFGLIVVGNLDEEIIEKGRGFIETQIPLIHLPDQIVIPYASIIVTVIAFAVTIALFSFIFKKVSILFKNIYQTKTPFTQKTVDVLKHISFAIFTYVGLEIFLNGLSAALMPKLYGFTVHVDIELAPLLVGLLILALSEIFDYGLTLQNDSESIL